MLELARSFHSRYYSVFPRELLPFGIQRFMQGRVLSFPCVPRDDDTPLVNVEARVCLWAFGCPKSPDSEGGIKWTTIWYNLITYYPNEEPRRVGICRSCHPSLNLYRHPLYVDGRQQLKKELARWSRDNERTPWLSPLLRPEDSLSPELEFICAPGNMIAYWQGHLTCITPAADHPEFDVAALLEINNGVMELGERERNNLANRLQRAVTACCKLLSGELNLQTQDPDVFVDFHLGRQKAGLPRPATVATDVGAPLSCSAPRSAEQVVDRLIDICRGRAIPEKVHPLDILFITRCGEPPEAAIENGKKEQEFRGAHAKFLIGDRQRQEMRELIRHLYEQKELIPRLLEGARLYHGDQYVIKNIDEALKGLGLIRRDMDETCLYSDPTRWQFEFDAAEIPRLFENALSRSFPVSTVISNRIMGHCSCECVNSLYKSLKLRRTFGGYPLIMALAEISLFSDELKERLFYVPLSIPASYVQQTPEGFFRSFAVAMCPPSVVPSEDFREIMNTHSSVLYGALLMDSYRLLAEATKETQLTQEMLNTDPDKAIEYYRKLADKVRAALLQAIRLANFSEADVIDDNPDYSLWGARWPAMKNEPFAHYTIGKELENIGQYLSQSALLPRREREAILDQSFRNIWHGGLTEDLKFLITRVSDLYDLDEIPRETLHAIVRELRNVQSHYQLLAKRAAWDYQSDMRCDRSGCCLLYYRAIAAIISRYRETKPEIYCALRACAPADITIYDSVNVRDNCDVVFEIFNILLGNILNHELTKQLRIHNLATDVCDCRGWQELVENASSVGLDGEYLSTLSSILPTDSCATNGSPLHDWQWGISMRWLYKQEIEAKPDPQQPTYRIPNILRAAYRRWIPDAQGEGAILFQATPFHGEENDYNRKVTQGGDYFLKRDGGMGLLVLSRITRVYCPKPKHVPHLPREEPLPAVSALSGEYSGVYVLVPGEYIATSGGIYGGC